MFIYLDDKRTPKMSNMQVARSYKQCINMLKSNKIELLSLDHDLGGDKSGYAVAIFLVEHNIEVPHINIHSRNTVGRDNMLQLLQRYFPNIRITCETEI